jgi:disulfide bond formation protein DsbB
MTKRQYILLATFGSIALLAGAFAFQYLGGLAPCKLCLWQRYPHAVAILAGALALSQRWPGFIVLGALSALATAGLGLYHTGVENGWWEGPTTCSSGPVSDLTPAELMDQILAAPLVRCDDIAWQFLNLSMASWNAILSLGLVALWVVALRAR